MVLRAPEGRRGVAAAELAVLLPLLMFLFLITVDWGRIFYYTMAVNNCARNGALYASDAYAMTQSPYASVAQAALADAPDLSPSPAVAAASGTDASGRSYVECTVTYNFRTVTTYPGIPSDSVIVRTVRMHTAPRVPN